MSAARKKRLSSQQYVAGIKAGDKLILSQAITIIESSLGDDHNLSEEILNQCLNASSNSIRVGITGVPGVGKSTFIEQLGRHIVSEGTKLAVLALDPSSQRSGGSIMGDKTRMEELSRESSVFIRPSPAGKSIGGVGPDTHEAIILCEAAGYDTILVETVGVGQSETAVNKMVDFFMLLMLPGSGDELQGIKRGIMEMADLIVITKADGSQRDLAKKAQADFNFALGLLPHSFWGWSPQAMAVSALNNEGIPQVWNQVLQFQEQMKKSRNWEKRRQLQRAEWFKDTIQNRLESDFYQNPQINRAFESLLQKVKAGTIPVHSAARQLMRKHPMR